MSVTILTAIALGAGHAMAAGHCVQSGSSVTCTYDAGDNTFTVPPGVSSVHVEAIGGTGGDASVLSNTPGGHGADVTGDLPVTPGHSLRAVVGGNASSHTGGANGGGDGGAAYAGGGGGASVVEDTDNGIVLVIAAGGGGAGGAESTLAPGGGGGAASDDGEHGTPSGFGPGGGGGSSGDNGGAGSTGAEGSGGNGAFLQGGTGGSPMGGGAGGGGGAGLVGGGGGGSSGGGGGGGGGGSSLVPSGGAVSVDTTGTPMILISYSTQPLPTIGFTSGPPPSGTVGQAYAYTYTASGDSGITFAVTAGNLPPGLNLSPDGNLSGTPTTAGSYPYTVTASGASGASASRQDAIEVAATAPQASASPSSVAFGDQTVGTASETRTVTLSSTGTAPLTVSGAAIGGSDSDDFTKSADTCTGRSLDPGTSCTVEATFHPTTSGPRSATLTFTDDAGNQTVDLSGNGIQPVSDLKVDLSGSPDPVKSGTTLTYTSNLTNNGPDDAGHAQWKDSLPADESFQSISAPAGWSCGTPAAGQTGTITCTASSIASGDSATFTLKVTVAPNRKKDTISDTVTASSQSADPNPDNNMATASVTVRGGK